jgi:hypothetical protein
LNSVFLKKKSIKLNLLPFSKTKKESKSEKCEINYCYLCVFLSSKKRERKEEIFLNQNKSEKVQVINYLLSPPCVLSKRTLQDSHLVFGKKVIGQVNIRREMENSTS